MDVRNAEQVESDIKEAVEFGGGRLDIAFNNAGIEESAKKTHEIDEEIFNRTIETNLYGVWRCYRAEVIAMLKQENNRPRRGRGVFINVSSVNRL